MNNNENIAKSIGGQAVIEGVMMRNKSMYCMAVRNMDTKEIHIEKNPLNSISARSKIYTYPLIRGVVSFIDSMILGIKILSKSASLAGLDDDNEKSKIEIWYEKKFGNDTMAKDNLMNYIVYISAFISIILSVLIFMVLPVWISSLISNFFIINLSAIGVVEGFVRIFIFVFYLFIISKMKDVSRTFMYHGAEHKTINCFEKGDKLSIENIKKHTRLHKRCGTSFLAIVMIVSMIIFMFLRTDNIALRVTSRIILVPLIAGISYEFIRLAGKYDNIFIKIVSFPGILLQRLTTKEPDDDMIELAILSLNGVLDHKDTN